MRQFGSDQKRKGVIRGSARVGVAAVAGWIGLAGVAAAQPCGPSDGQCLFASDGQTDDRFGEAIALSADGTTLVVGAHLDHIGSEFDAGTVSIYTLVGSVWMFQAKLSASDFAEDDEFGDRVAISADGNTVAVGAPYDDRPGLGDAGAAYIFTRSGTAWTEQAKIIAGTTGPHNLDYFGGDVALSADGNTVAIGASRWDQGSISDEGAVYVFTRSGTVWTQAALLRATQGGHGDRLGASVAISADASVIAAAASSDDTDTPPSLLNAGSVSVFRKSSGSWVNETKLRAPDVEQGDSFGTDVAMSSDGQTIAVGMAFDTTTGGGGAGSVRVFTSPGWAQQAMLVSADPASSENFGISVSLSGDGDKLIAGCFGDTIAGQINAGSVTIFARSGSTWSNQGKLVSGDPELSDAFGLSTAISADGGTIAAGEYKDDTLDSVIDTGSVWVFGAPCAADLSCDGIVDFADYLEFLNLFDAQDPAVDFNQDGVVDFADYLEFLNLFDAGC